MIHHRFYLASFITISAVCLSCKTGSAQSLRAISGPYELQVLVGGSPTRLYYHRGESYVMGQIGENYTLRVINHTGRRVEAVISVDGRDVIDGQTSNVNKRGYIIGAWGSVDISGWRMSNKNVAAFRFSSVADSYAARTGSARNVGVIGVAIFPERRWVPPQPTYTPRRDDESSSDNSWFKRRSRMLSQNEAKMKSENTAPTAQERSAESSYPSAGASPAPSSAPKGISAEQDRLATRRRSGLGTAYGEPMHAPVVIIPFYRANKHHPSAYMGARYNDYEGLLSMGVNLSPDVPPVNDTWLRQTARPFPASTRRYAPPPPGWEY